MHAKRVVHYSSVYGNRNDNAEGKKFEFPNESVLQAYPKSASNLIGQWG